jgi:polyisoprenoid-binding protein YceI
MQTAQATDSKTKWVLDPAHSELVFKVKHLMISNVKGEFRNFQVEIDGEDIESSSIKVGIDSSSVYTKNDDRDTHLKSADFLDTENHKEITFESTSIERKDDDNYRLKGLLTIKGVSREVQLDVEHGGTSKDPWGNEKAGYSVTGKINRKDWGLNWNAVLETGGVLVSDEVKINAEVQFVKQS